MARDRPVTSICASASAKPANLCPIDGDLASPYTRQQAAQRVEASRCTDAGWIVCHTKHSIRGMPGTAREII